MTRLGATFGAPSSALADKKVEETCPKLASESSYCTASSRQSGMGGLTGMRCRVNTNKCSNVRVHREQQPSSRTTKGLETCLTTGNRNDPRDGLPPSTVAKGIHCRTRARTTVHQASKGVLKGLQKSQGSAKAKAVWRKYSEHRNTNHLTCRVLPSDFGIAHDNRTDVHGTPKDSSHRSAQKYRDPEEIRVELCFTTSDSLACYVRRYDSKQKPARPE